MFLKTSLLTTFLLLGFVSCQTWKVTFHLFSKTQTNGVEVTATSLATAPGYDRNKDVLLIIHGFGGSKESGCLLKIKDALLAYKDVNIVLVDWKDGAAQPNYFTAAPNTKVAGARVADFLKAAGIPGSQVHCIGHSLGAHCCGHAGKNYKLRRITGLDPAGPFFQNNLPANRLAVGDADLVDCMHTDKSLGIQDPIGDKNYYPNGGAFQTGCPTIGKRDVEVELDMDNYKNDPLQYELDSMIYHVKLSPKDDETDLVGCSHNRVCTYFAESVAKKVFRSTPCDNHKNFESGVCSCSQEFGCCSMGFYANESPQRTRFHLNTNPAAPFSLD